MREEREGSEMEQALIELVKTGGPIAQSAIYLYYAQSILEDVLICGTLMGLGAMGYRLVRIWQKWEFRPRNERGY